MWELLVLFIVHSSPLTSSQIVTLAHIVFGFIYFWSGVLKLNPFARTPLTFFMLVENAPWMPPAQTLIEWLPILFAGVGETLVGVFFFAHVMMEKTEKPNANPSWMRVLMAKFIKLVAFS